MVNSNLLFNSATASSLMPNKVDLSFASLDTDVGSNSKESPIFFPKSNLLALFSFKNSNDIVVLLLIPFSFLDPSASNSLNTPKIISLSSAVSTEDNLPYRLLKSSTC